MTGRDTGLITSLTEAGARITLRCASWLTGHKTMLSGLALLTAVMVGTAYLTFGALRTDPLATKTVVKVHLAQSGGLMAGQDVTLRGIPVGRVRSVDLVPDGVVAVVDITGSTRIPANSAVRVSSLSPAGEQYIDLQPPGDGGPYLTDGADVGVDRTATPATLASALGNLNGVLAQVDPAQVKVIIDELRISRDGPEKLSAIVDGGVFLLSTLDSVLPQTVSLLRSSRVVFGTIADVDPGIRATSANFERVLSGAAAKDAGFRTLLDRGPGALRALDDVIADNSPTMVQLLGNLTTVAQLTYLRVPALQALFPTTRGSTLGAVASTFHDGGFWGAADAYPRYSCDYDLPRFPPSVPDFHEPYLYAQCNNPDPDVLIRGARNAPRPPGVDAAIMPPGANPAQQSDPAPVGTYTVPTTYGGPQMPVIPPR